MVQETENRYFMRRVIGWLACLGPVSMHILPVWFNRLLLGTMSHSLLKGELVDLFIDTMPHTMVYDVVRHYLANLSSHKLTLSQQYHQSSQVPLWVFFQIIDPSHHRCHQLIFVLKIVYQRDTRYLGTVSHSFQKVTRNLLYALLQLTPLWGYVKIL